MTTREVVLDGGSPWGFRLHGGADVNQPLRISRVNPGSKAALRGIREGDFITSINNQSTKDISNAEAHALLRNSGDTLKLGLNEDVNGSPKRRQYKTVHQETHSETVKKSSITSYSVTSSKTVETSKTNENTSVNGDPVERSKNPVASQRSTLSSNCSSSSSTSTYTSLTSPSGTDMADNARSRRKRSRNNRKKAKHNTHTGEIIVEESCEEYRVDSPKRPKSPETKKPIKSRSLDDDDLIKIQELSEVSETEDKSECKAIISEAESDFEWEQISTMDEPETQTGTITTLNLPLEQHTTEQVPLISPEEELTLRNFLEGLNLVNCPEDAFRQVREISTMESVKSSRAHKRAAIEQYFLPMVHNPRFLDVISEEASDLSDREQSVTHHLKQGTPEPEVPRKTRKIIENPTFLLATKIVDIPSVQSIAEVVFLEDSSNSTTPDPKSDDEDKDTVDELLSSTNSSVPDLREHESGEQVKSAKVWNELTPPPTPPKREESNFAQNVQSFAQNTANERLVEVKIENEFGSDFTQGKLLLGLKKSTADKSEEKIVDIVAENAYSQKSNESCLKFDAPKEATTVINSKSEETLKERIVPVELEVAQTKPETEEIINPLLISSENSQKLEALNEKTSDIEIETGSKISNSNSNFTVKIENDSKTEDFSRRIEAPKEEDIETLKAVDEKHNIAQNFEEMEADDSTRKFESSKEKIIQVDHEENCSNSSFGRSETIKEKTLGVEVKKQYNFPEDQDFETTYVSIRPETECYSPKSTKEESSLNVEIKHEDISKGLEFPKERNISSGKSELIKESPIKDKITKIEERPESPKERIIPVELSSSRSEFAKKQFLMKDESTKIEEDTPKRPELPKERIIPVHLSASRSELTKKESSITEKSTKIEEDTPKRPELPKERIMPVQLFSSRSELTKKESSINEKSTKIEDTPKRPELPKERIIPVQLSSGRSELTKKESSIKEKSTKIEEDTPKRPELPKERIIPVHLSSSRSELNKEESSIKNKITKIEEDTLKRPESPKEIMIPVHLSSSRSNLTKEEFSIKDKTTKIEEDTSKKPEFFTAGIGPIHLFSSRSELTKKESLINDKTMKIEKDTLKKPESPRERIIPVDLSSSQPTTKESLIKDKNTEIKEETPKKPESPKERIIPVHLSLSRAELIKKESSSNDKTMKIEEDTPKKPEFSNERIIPVHLSSGRPELIKKQSSVNDKTTKIEERPESHRERIIPIHLLSSRSELTKQESSINDKTTKIEEDTAKRPELPKERIIPVHHANFLSGGTESTKKESNNLQTLKERIIPVRQDNNYANLSFGRSKSTEELTKSFISRGFNFPKERIIPLHYEKFSKFPFVRSTSTKQETKLDHEDILRSSEAPKERIIPVHHENSYANLVFRRSKSTEELATPFQSKISGNGSNVAMKQGFDFPRARILPVYYENDFNNFPFGRSTSTKQETKSGDASRKPGFLKERIIPVRHENLSTTEETRSIESKTTFEDAPNAKTKIEDIPRRPEPPITIHHQNDFSNIYFDRTETIKDASSVETKYEDVPRRPELPKETIIPVYYKKNSSNLPFNRSESTKEEKKFFQSEETKLTNDCSNFSVGRSETIKEQTLDLKVKKQYSSSEEDFPKSLESPKERIIPVHCENVYSNIPFGRSESTKHGIVDVAEKKEGKKIEDCSKKLVEEVKIKKEEMVIPVRLEENISKEDREKDFIKSPKETIIPVYLEKGVSDSRIKETKKLQSEGAPKVPPRRRKPIKQTTLEDASQTKPPLVKLDNLPPPVVKISPESMKLEGLSTLKSLLSQPEVESPSKEVENLCPKSLFYSNVLSPSVPSPSPSLSSGSSSRATSLCTAKYNPMSSSIADISSIKESPLSLRELCVNFLMAQPFGSDILQELADVSSSIEHLTKKLSWVGLPTEKDPNLLVCLSPTQKSQLDKSKKTSDEAAKLLDLHEKFIYRTTYHDAVERQVKNEVEISAIKPDVSNRLLAIIRDVQEPKIRKFSTLPRNMDSARLKAKDLSEWLHLARNKSRSELNLTDENNQNVGNAQRRKSLPHDFYEQQMHYLQEKEREIQRELEMLEEEKRRLAMEMTPRKFRPEDYHISKQGDFAENKKTRPISMPISTEFFRQQMYEEYMDQIAAREERKQHKVIKVSQVDETGPNFKTPTGIEDEFMTKVKQKQQLGTLNKADDTDDDTSDQTIPKHIQEFMEIAKASDGVWSPGQNQGPRPEEPPKSQQIETKNEPISPIWTPKSATSSPTVERKEFRPVKFESPVLSRKNFNKNEEVECSETSKEPPWKLPETSSDTGFVLSTTLEKRLPTSHSSPGFNDFPTARLPRAQNPTITLLQKAREGQLPKGALYIEQEQSLKRPPLVGPGEILYKIKSEYTSESDSEKPRKMADLGPRKYEGIGPTTKDGMPLILRSEVKDANQSKWYKKMYDTIHKQRPHRDEFVTVRYKQRRGQYPYTSGYLSEPEPGAYDSDFTDYKYATLDRRRVIKDKENDYIVSSTMPRSAPDKVGASLIKHVHDPYKNQPGRIENYIPGHSSISEKEAKEWWDEVMDIFDGHLEQQKRVPQTKSFINQALKESGYESDSTLVFRRRDDTAQQLSPSEQKEAYKTIQRGGDVPLYGLRKPAPERPKESPRKYVENEVTIHYKTPVRQEIKEYLSEDELAYRQAEAMKKIYQEERRRKYLQVSKSLQELQDMNNRRHTDNFIPSQKSPIPLNRYDDLDDLAPPVKPRPRSPEPRLMARALYNFVGQTARELTFRKGDLIYVRRQVDKNWYEGELNAMVGLFPVNYVEIVTYDTAKPTPRKSHEGQARAKYNFVAQTHLELSLAKGELVIITRRVDDNWFEGKIGGRKGIFPVSYVDVLIDANDPLPPSSKPVASPAAHSLLLNGSAGGKESMGSHSYTPNLSSNQLTSSYHAKPVQATGSYGSLNRGNKNPINQTLHIETHSEPVPYRALYKYLPQNDDELELLEGDTVYVLEKCDDGWYVGSSDRTGAFGTFPGNYVEKI